MSAIGAAPPSLRPLLNREVAAGYANLLKDQHALGVTLCSVCAGAFVLGETGLLAGRAVTTPLQDQVFDDEYAGRCSAVTTRTCEPS